MLNRKKMDKPTIKTVVDMVYYDGFRKGCVMGFVATSIGMLIGVGGSILTICNEAKKIEGKPYPWGTGTDK